MMTFQEKIDLILSLQGNNEIRFSNEARRARVMPGDGGGIKETTKPWHIEWGYTTSDTVRWCELGIMGEGDTIEEAADDCIRRQAERLAHRAGLLRKQAAQLVNDAKSVEVQVLRLDGAAP